MGFTSHGGDPQWLRDQRAAQTRAMEMPVRRAMPYPSQTPQQQPKVVSADPAQFVQGARNNSGAAFVLGAIVGYLGGRSARR